MMPDDTQQTNCNFHELAAIITIIAIVAVSRYYTCRLLTCGPQSGRTSAPIMPHRVQTMRWQSERTGNSSGRWSAFMVVL
jgi:hypothetical protein